MYTTRNCRSQKRTRSMSSQRLMLAFAVLATLAMAVQCENAIFGYRRVGDALAATRFIRRSAVAGNQVVAADSFSLVNGQRITAVEVLDRSLNKRASFASIVSGGPGQTTATISFRGIPSFGIDYEIRYFAL